MARRKTDLTGQKFSRWLVVGKALGGWLCKCDCGIQKIIRTNSLTSGKSRSCGCFAKEVHAKSGKKNLKDLTGKRFGRLYIENRAGSDSRGEALWLCRCDCGKKEILKGSTLRNGSVISCGCYGRKRRRPDISGQRFGRLVAVKRLHRVDKGIYFWQCLCDCGKTVNVRRYNLIGGSTKSCGCLNDEMRRKRAANLIGEKFGRLTVVERLGTKRTDSKHTAALWLSECDCGKRVCAYYRGYG